MNRVNPQSLLFVVLCSLLFPASVASVQEPPLWPGAKYDSAIPTIKSVLGHDHGEVITPPEGVAQYLQALQKVRAQLGAAVLWAAAGREMLMMSPACSGSS